MAWDLKMRNFAVRRLVVCGLSVLLGSHAQAELKFEITDFVGQRAPIAIVPFGWEGESPDTPFDVAGVIEARGCERFEKIATALEEGELKDFYRRISQAEAQHTGLFLRLANNYFPAETVEGRCCQLLDIEAVPSM